MDLHEIWQENKRWILSCVAGLLVFLIAYKVIGGIYDSTAVAKAISGTRKAISEKQYRVNELRLARDNHQQIQAAFEKLKRAMHFPVPAGFQVPAGEDHELFWARRKREVADHLLNLAAEANVDLREAAFRWPSPVERGEIERALVGLCILDQAVQRLIRAHRAVTVAHPDAVGLRRVHQLQIKDTKPGRGTAPRRNKDEKQAEDYVDEFLVKFTVYADYRTVDRFLESCRNSPMPLGLRGLEISQASARPGEPLKATGDLVGVVVRPLQEGL